MENKQFYTKTEVDKLIYEMRQELINYIKSFKNNEGINSLSDGELINEVDREEDGSNGE